MSEQIIIDFSDQATRRELLWKLDRLRGPHRIEVTKFRPKRSNLQNAWYWAAVVTPFARMLSDGDYDVTDPEDAHDILKDKFLRVDIVNKETGEIIGHKVGSTKDLDTAGFSQYCDRCVAWLADFFGLVISDPRPRE